MRILPPELIDIVIDSLSDDWRTLAACALVHSEWAPRARSHLRHGIVLAVECQPHCSESDIDGFLRIFGSSSSLAPHVSNLTIRGPPQSSVKDLLPIPETLTFAHLPCLRSLTLRSIIVSDVNQFLPVLRSCELLEELYIEDVGAEVTATSRRGITFQEILQHISPPRPFLVRLKTLCIKDCDKMLSAPLLWPIGLMFTRGIPVAPVQSLTLHLCGPPASSERDVMRVDTWHGPISNMRKTITDLSITVPIPLGDHIPRPNLGYLSSAIFSCRHLRRFVLRYDPTAAQPASNAVHLHALDELFNPADAPVDTLYITVDPRIKARKSKFQELEVITLIIPLILQSTDMPSFETELARLARSMSKDKLFPALRWVRIGVECGCGKSMEEMASPIASALRLLKERGISTDVAELRKDEWEAWSIASQPAAETDFELN